MTDCEARRGAERIEHILDAAAEPAEIVAEAAGLTYSDPGWPVALRFGGWARVPPEKSIPRAHATRALATPGN